MENWGFCRPSNSLDSCKTLKDSLLMCNCSGQTDNEGIERSGGDEKKPEGEQLHQGRNAREQLSSARCDWLLMIPRFTTSMPGVHTATSCSSVLLRRNLARDAAHVDDLAYDLSHSDIIRTPHFRRSIRHPHHHRNLLQDAGLVRKEVPCARRFVNCPFLPRVFLNCKN